MLSLTVYLETGKLLLLWPTCLSGLSRARPLLKVSFLSVCICMCVHCVLYMCARVCAGALT